MPSNVNKPNVRCQKAISKSIVIPTCAKPTTETRAGGPAANAFVRKSWPIVADSPTPTSSATVCKSNVSARVVGNTNNAKMHAASATAEKWATIERVSIYLTWCKPMSAIALVNELRSAAPIAR